MIELYHWEPNGAGARVLVTLKEKGIAFVSRYVDVLGFEQHAPEFLELHETGETPVLVHDGAALSQSSYICEYLEEVFPAVPLMPKDPLERWEARFWQKYVDDHLGAYVSDLAWNAYGPTALEGRNAVPASVEAIACKERRDVWQAALAGYSAEQLDRARSRVELALNKMEEDLADSDWLAGIHFSLADIAVWAYLAYLPRLLPDLVNAGTAPRTLAWLERMSQRPGVKAALEMARTADPFAAAAPGPEHVRWG